VQLRKLRTERATASLLHPHPPADADTLRTPARQGDLREEGCGMRLRGNDAHRNFRPCYVRYYSITFASSQSTASSSCTRRTNRFSPLREYTSACVPVFAESPAPKSKTRMPFAGLAETDFASNRPASAAKVTAAADEFESKRPSKNNMSGLGRRKMPISSPLQWMTRSALTSPTREFHGSAPYGLFSLMAPLHIAAAPQNVTLA
jgi:hypothetical protein